MFQTLSDTFVRKSLFSSSSGSCQGRDANLDGRWNLQSQIHTSAARVNHDHGQSSFPVGGKLNYGISRTETNPNPHLWSWNPDCWWHSEGGKENVSGTTDRLILLNSLDDSGSIKFTNEMESEGKLPFLDLLIVWSYRYTGGGAC